MPELTIRERIIEVSLQRPFREPSTVRLDRDMLWIFKDHALGHIYKHGKVIAIGVWRREDLERAGPGKAKCSAYLSDFVYSKSTGRDAVPRKSVVHKNGDILDNTIANLELKIPVKSAFIKMATGEPNEDTDLTPPAIVTGDADGTRPS